jgi:hypothetical protein
VWLTAKCLPVINAKPIFWFLSINCSLKRGRSNPLRKELSHENPFDGATLRQVWRCG